MQIYRNFAKRAEEAYDGYYVCFINMLIKPILPSKQQKKLYNVTISTGPTGGGVLWSSGVEKNRKSNERPPQPLGT